MARRGARKKNKTLPDAGDDAGASLSVRGGHTDEDGARVPERGVRVPKGGPAARRPGLRGRKRLAWVLTVPAVVAVGVAALTPATAEPRDTLSVTVDSAPFTQAQLDTELAARPVHVRTPATVVVLEGKVPVQVAGDAPVGTGSDELDVYLDAQNGGVGSGVIVGRELSSADFSASQASTVLQESLALGNGPRAVRDALAASVDGQRAGLDTFLIRCLSALLLSALALLAWDWVASGRLRRNSPAALRIEADLAAARADLLTLGSPHRAARALLRAAEDLAPSAGEGALAQARTAALVARRLATSREPGAALTGPALAAQLRWCVDALAERDLPASAARAACRPGASESRREALLQRALAVASLAEQAGEAAGRADLAAAGADGMPRTAPSVELLSGGATPLPAAAALRWCTEAREAWALPRSVALAPGAPAGPADSSEPGAPAGTEPADGSPLRASGTQALTQLGLLVPTDAATLAAAGALGAEPAGLFRRSDPFRASPSRRMLALTAGGIAAALVSGTAAYAALPHVTYWLATPARGTHPVTVELTGPLPQAGRDAVEASVQRLRGTIPVTVSVTTVPSSAVAGAKLSDDSAALVVPAAERARLLAQATTPLGTDASGELPIDRAAAVLVVTPEGQVAALAAASGGALDTGGLPPTEFTSPDTSHPLLTPERAAASTVDLARTLALQDRWNTHPAFLSLDYRSATAPGLSAATGGAVGAAAFAWVALGAALPSRRSRAVRRGALAAWSAPDARDEASAGTVAAAYRQALDTEAAALSAAGPRESSTPESVASAARLRALAARLDRPDTDDASLTTWVRQGEVEA